MGMGQQNPPDCTESPKYKTASAGKKFRPPQKRLGETGAVYYNKREQRAQPAEKEEAHDSQCGRLPVYRLRDVRGGGAGRVSDPGAGVRGAGPAPDPGGGGGGLRRGQRLPGSMPSGPGRHEKEPPAGAFQRAAFFIQSRFTRKSPRAAASARRCLSAARASSIPPMIWLDTRKPRGVRCQRPSSSTA